MDKNTTKMNANYKNKDNGAVSFFFNNDVKHKNKPQGNNGNARKDTKSLKHKTNEQKQTYKRTQ